MPTDLLIVNDKGIFCEAADVYIDPWRAVDKALITHAHSDHARYGHRHYLAHKTNQAVLKLRLGNIRLQPLEYNEVVTINGVKFSFHPAGHIPGSAQIRVEHKGEVWVVSGDYKFGDDGISVPFEPVRCHTFISESTFGLPVYHWQNQQLIFEKINQWWKQNADENRCSVIFGYSLGKAQRILQGLDESIGKIFTHGAIENTNKALIAAGIELKKTEQVSTHSNKEEFKNAIVIAPPSAAESPWMKKFGDYASAFCSGWMQVRGNRRRNSMDTGFVLSDHADWESLNIAVESSGAERVFITHGFSDVFARYLCEKGYDARVLKTLYEGDQALVSEENIDTE
jgi:putative mRNA 3-end processing factor